MRWILSIAASLIVTSSLQAKTFRVASIIPKGTAYSDALIEFSKEVEKVTEKRVQFRFYWGGIMGDEPQLIQKINNNSLHGGVFTAASLATIYPDIRVLEIPFTFNSREQAGKALTSLRAYFVEGLSKATPAGAAAKGVYGYQSLGLYELGEIYLVSAMPTPSLDSLRSQKLWLMHGDKLAEAFMKEMNLAGTSMELPVVYSNLGDSSSKGLNAAYAPASAIIALQWQEKVSQLIEPPFGYHFQGFVLHNRSWQQIDEKDQKAIKALVANYEEKISKLNLGVTDEALKAIKAANTNLVTWPDSDVASIKKLRDQLVKSISGEIVSKEAIDKLNALM